MITFLEKSTYFILLSFSLEDPVDILIKHDEVKNKKFKKKIKVNCSQINLLH